MVKHKNLKSSERHEPKGLAGASANEVYISDGNLSGSWGKVTPPDINESVLYAEVTTGYEKTGGLLDDVRVKFDNTSKVSFGSNLTLGTSGNDPYDRITIGKTGNLRVSATFRFYGTTSPTIYLADPAYCYGWAGINGFGYKTASCYVTYIKNQVCNAAFDCWIPVTSGDFLELFWMQNFVDNSTTVKPLATASVPAITMTCVLK